MAKAFFAIVGYIEAVAVFFCSMNAVLSSNNTHLCSDRLYNLIAMLISIQSHVDGIFDNYYYIVLEEK